MTRTATKTNEKALDAFVAKSIEASLLARKVVAALDDHLGLEPDAVHWGHVGDMDRILEVLREAHRVACERDALVEQRKGKPADLALQSRLDAYDAAYDAAHRGA